MPTKYSIAVSSIFTAISCFWMALVTSGKLSKSFSFSKLFSSTARKLKLSWRFSLSFLYLDDFKFLNKISYPFITYSFLTYIILLRTSRFSLSCKILLTRSATSFLTAATLSSLLRHSIQICFVSVIFLAYIKDIVEIFLCFPNHCKT